MLTPVGLGAFVCRRIGDLGQAGIEDTGDLRVGIDMADDLSI